MPAGRVVLCDQAAALARVTELVDAEALWRADRRRVTLAVLRGLVCGMNWTSGLVAGMTRAHLAAGAGCSPRTVSRVVAWAVEVGLVVVVETGATAAFLGTEANRAPSYVLTRPPTAVPEHRVERPAAGGVDELGNPPACCVEQRSPRRDRGLTDHHQGPHDPGRAAGGAGDVGRWPVFDLASTPSERAAAVDTLLERTGIGGRVVRWRARALLGPWFEAGWCVAGLLHALDHHPGQPAGSRGDAARAARDPLAVLGHRLRPWRGRLDELPAAYGAVDGAARRLRAAELAETDPEHGTDLDSAWRHRAGAAAAAEPSAAARSARAEIGRVLDRRRARPRPTRPC